MEKIDSNYAIGAEKSRVVRWFDRRCGSGGRLAGLNGKFTVFGGERHFGNEVWMAKAI